MNETSDANNAVHSDPNIGTNPVSKSLSQELPVVTRGWQTSEFWMTLLGHLGLVGATLAGVLPPKYAALAAAASQVAYNLSRGLVKSGAAAARD